MNAKQFLEKVGIPKGNSEESLTAFAEEYAEQRSKEFADFINKSQIRFDDMCEEGWRDNGDGFYTTDQLYKEFQSQK